MSVRPEQRKPRQAKPNPPNTPTGPNGKPENQTRKTGCSPPAKRQLMSLVDRKRNKLASPRSKVTHTDSPRQEPACKKQIRHNRIANGDNPATPSHQLN